MKFKKILLLIMSLSLLCSCEDSYEYTEPASYNTQNYTRESAGIRLEDDYYGYQNFDFLWNNTIPADMSEYSYGALAEKQTDQILTDIILDIVNSGSDYPKGSDKQKIKDLYLMCFDNGARESVGLKALDNAILGIENARGIEEFVKACGDIYCAYGCEILPMPYFTQDHYDSGTYSAVIGQMDLFYSAEELVNGKNTAEDLQKSVASILSIADYENADICAYDIVTLLLEIAESTSDMTDASVEKLYNIYANNELFDLFKMSYSFCNSGKYIVYDPLQLTKISDCLTEDNLSVWKAFAKCKLVYEYKDYLPESYQSIINPTDNRTFEEKAIAIIKQELAGEVGNIYADANCDDKTLAAVEAMAEDIRGAYRNCIENSKLLSESDRSECLKKIDAMTLNIGYPKDAYNSGSQISGGLLESGVSIKSSLVRKNLELENNMPQATDWYITPQTFNAVYTYASNSVTLPMALFSAPYFDTQADYYTNLGGLGSIIAHEIGHAFDSQGIMYDENGNYNPKRISQNRTTTISAAVESYYATQTIMDVFYINGKLTASENTADLSGMQVIASMTDNYDELRLIFVSYAKIWATLSVDTNAAEQIASDVHSPAEIRVNAVLSSIDKFYDVYSIAQNDGMYVPTDARVRVW